jgi:hypothetical protein
MAKFKPVRPKSTKGPAPHGALGCVILILLGMTAVFLVMIFAMRG